MGSWPHPERGSINPHLSRVFDAVMRPGLRPLPFHWDLETGWAADESGPQLWVWPLPWLAHPLPHFLLQECQGLKRLPSRPCKGSGGFKMTLGWGYRLCRRGNGWLVSRRPHRCPALRPQSLRPQARPTSSTSFSTQPTTESCSRTRTTTACMWAARTTCCPWTCMTSTVSPSL